MAPKTSRTAFTAGAPGAEAAHPLSPEAGERPPAAGGAAQAHGSRRPPWRRALRWVGIGACVFLLWVAAWSLAGYFSFRDGVKDANKRLSPAAERQLSGQDGLVLTKPTTILLLGTDTAPGEARGLRHSDSMMLVRTDPDLHRMYYLSIPRDLWVEIPGYGTDRINTSYQVGGAPLAIRTVRSLTGIDIDHVAIVDFKRFKELIDSVGGIDITVPRASTPTDSSVPTTRQAARAGTAGALPRDASADGGGARSYSRIRENRLDPSDNDITAPSGSSRSRRRSPTSSSASGHSSVSPSRATAVATAHADLSANQLLQLAWTKFRTGDTIRCRLGGDPETIGGASVIVPPEENRNVISMFLDESAPQPPRPGTGTCGPGCVAGGRSLGSR